MIPIGALIVLWITSTDGSQNETIPNANKRNETANNRNATNADSSVQDMFKMPEIRVREPFFFSKAIKLQRLTTSLKNASAKCAKTSAKFREKSVSNMVIIDFPVFVPKSRCITNAAFLPLLDVKPVLVQKAGKNTLVRIAYIALLELSPLLALCLSCATLAGMIIWALDTRDNPGQFPKRFWRGIFDGIWWAMVTMTTVGYGDKAPKSFFARLFATVWMISGIILLSMFTAQVSSRLTTEELKNEDHTLGKTIGVPSGLEMSEYVDDILKNSLVEEYHSTKEFLNALTNETFDSALVFHCEDREMDTSFEALLFLEICQVGAVMSVNLTEESSDRLSASDYFDYINCMKAQTTLTQNQVQQGSNSKDKSRHSCNKLSKGTDYDKFTWVYFEDFQEYLLPLGGVIGAILLLSILGGIFTFSFSSLPLVSPFDAYPDKAGDTTGHLVDLFLFQDHLPGLNLAFHCKTPISRAYPTVFRCPHVEEGVLECQRRGKRVMLSIGGSTGDGSLFSPDKARTLAKNLWNMFLNVLIQITSLAQCITGRF